MPVRFGSILHLNNSASEATLDANNLRGTTVQIDKFDSASLATIGVGLTTAPGKRRLGTIVATTGSADAGVKYYAFIQTSSGDTLLSGSEWTTLTNWKQIQVDATTIDTSSFVLNSATSSFILESQTSSFVNNSATSSFVLNSATSSFVNNSATSSFVLNSATSSFVNNSATSSFVNNSATSSFVLNSATSSFVNNSATSSFILESQTGSFVLESETGSFLLNTTDTFEGVLTLSGNLSVTGDGNITASNGTFEGGIIRANTDSENYIKGALSFKGGAQAYRAATIARGGASLGTVSGDVGTADLVISTNNLNNFFIFKGNTTGGGALIISGARSPESGSPSLDVRGPISASGNISSSGDIIATNVSASELRISNPSHTGNLRFFQDSDNSYRLTSNIGTIFDFGNTNVITTAQRIDGTRGIQIKTLLDSDPIRFRDFDDNNIILVDHSGSLTLGNASGHEPHVIINTNVTASGDISASGDIFANNIRAVGDVIAQRYIVSSSVSHITQSFSSGSTIFGDTSNDTHQFTGSLSITGSSVTSERTPLVITAGGEVQVADADFIVAGEFVANSATSSFVNNSATSSFVFNSSTGSFVLESETGSFALTSNVVANTSTGSFVLESETGSFIITASATNNVITFTGGDGGTFTVTVDTGSSTTITGTNKQVLFFDGDDNPAGDSGLTYNKSSDTLFISGNIEHAGDANTGIFFGSDTITLKGNNAQIAKFDTSQIIFNENVNGEFNGLFLSGGFHDWGKNNDVDSTSGFRVVSDRAYTHVTPQFTRARHALVGSIIRDPSVMNLAAFPLNYLVYSKAGVTINGGSNDTDPDVDTPVDPKIAGGKDNIGIPVVQIAGDLEIRPTQSMDGGGTTPGIRIAAGDSSGSVDPGIFFYNRDNISNDSSSFFYSSASAEIRFDTGSNSLKFFAGSTSEDLKEVLHISKSGDNPRIGVGLSNPIKAFDFKEVRDDNRGAELLIRGSRTTRGADVNDEVGRINFAIDSASFGKIETSGSAAEIVSLVDAVDPTGIQGSLSLRVAAAKSAGTLQRMKLIGNPNSSAIEFTGSAAFDNNVDIIGNVNISGAINSLSGDITASGNISASGTILAEDYLLPTAGGSLKTQNNGEIISITDDNIDLGFGSSWALELRKNEGVVLYDQGNVGLYKDFRVEGESDTHLFFITGGDSRIGIGTSTPKEKLTVQGNVSASGNLIGNEITASGNVDIGGILSIPGFSSVSASLASAVAGGDNLGNHTATQDLDLDGNSIKDALHITASGKISASDTIITNQYLIQNHALSTFSSNTLRHGFDSSLVKYSYGKDSDNEHFFFGNITASGDISASGTIVGSNLSGTNTGDQDLSGFLSSSAQIASNISGAFTSTSASLASNVATNTNHISDLTAATSSYVNNSATSSFVFNSSTGSFAIAADVSGAFTSTSSSLATRLATAESELGNTLISSSAQIASDISGAFNASSASLAGNIATNTDHISDLTSVTGSYVNNSATSSFVFNSSTGSFAIAADISGAFDADSSSLATRLATAESELGNTLLSSSAQISTDISGAFTAASASLAANIVTNAGNIGTTTNALTVDNATLKLNSGTTFNGSAARTISIKDGGVDSDALAANIAVTQLTASAISASGTVTANSFTGNGLSIDGSSNSHIEVGTYNVGFDTAGINTLFITGSGLIVSGAMADANHHNMVKIGNVELIDLNSAVSANEFLIHNVNSLKITSGSDGGDIANDDNRLFEHNGTDFTLYRNNSSAINAAANGTLTFNGENISFVATTATFMRATNNTPGVNGHLIFTEGNPNTTPSELRSINWDSAFPFLGGAITASAVSASGTIVGSNLSGTNTGDQDLSGFLSSSAQIASNISGAFTSTSASLAGNIATNTDHIGDLTSVTGSYVNNSSTGSFAIAADVSGAFTSTSSSLAADIATNAGNIGTTTNALTVDNATLQLNSGTTFNGSAARTISIKDGGVDSDALADDITVAGTLTVAADIQHSGDTDTKIAFSTDVVSIKAGNTSVFTSSPTGSVLPNVHQNIFDTGSLALNANSAFGDIIKMGDTNTTAGGVYYLKNNGTWALAQANAAATSTGSLAVAVGTNSTTDGMCLRGLMNPFTDPGAGIGSPVYISDTHPGRILATAPSSTGDVVRIVGHQFGTDLIYFNPSNDFIVHA